MKKPTFWVTVVILIVVIISLTVQLTTAQTLNPETDIKTDQGYIQQTTNDQYVVHVQGISMRKAVDILVDATCKAKQTSQTFDKFTITWTGALYSLTYSNEPNPILTSTSFDEIKKELKKQVKLILDNL